MQLEFGSKMADKLRQIFSREVMEIKPVWDDCTWSITRQVTLSDGGTLFVKGTPRDRVEAEITLRLASLCPDFIPAVLEPDLLPESDWRWFILEDAGVCSHNGISADSQQYRNITTASAASIRSPSTRY
jgi:hypothetical protein